jgi:hypothetical protein
LQELQAAATLLEGCGVLQHNALSQAESCSILLFDG